MKRKNDEGWIQCYNGGYFYFDDPKPEMINILDVAMALGNCCRYTGQISQFYSVAEHSVHMSQFVTGPNHGTSSLCPSCVAHRYSPDLKVESIMESRMNDGASLKDFKSLQ